MSDTCINHMGPPARYILLIKRDRGKRDMEHGVTL